MKQSIIAIIRPNLNLSQKESQAAHLIEHLLVAPERLQSMGVTEDFYAKNIIFHGGQVNDFYLTEYYIAKSESADSLAQTLQQNNDKLYTSKRTYEAIRSALTEELRENRGEFIEMGEQLSKAIFLPGSPTIRNPWNDLKSIENLSLDEAVEIFHKYNSDLSLLNLTFNSFNIDKLPKLEKNRLRKANTIIELYHPWQSPGSVETTHFIPLQTKTDYLVSTLYRKSLFDNQFGLLYSELRHRQGLVYDISIDIDYDSDALEFYFSSSDKSTDRVTDQIKKALSRYDLFIQDHFKHIKGRLKLDLELDWGDVQGQYSRIIETVISGGYAESPSSLIERMDKISSQDLIKFNRSILYSFNNGVVSAKHRHGKTVATR